MIDTFVTHKLWGFPIFFALMWLMFWCTFSLGAYPQEWIDALVGWIGGAADALLPAGPLRDLLVDGVIGGVGAVIVFLPNIMILYLFISFMEDSGYLARAAFIMDRVMHRIGLHGKSFIPLVMGFAARFVAVHAGAAIELPVGKLLVQNIVLLFLPMLCGALFRHWRPRAARRVHELLGRVAFPALMLLAAVFFVQYASTILENLGVLHEEHRRQ